MINLVFKFMSLILKHETMILQWTLLYNWNNGVVMISIFALVCLILVGVLVNFMTSGKQDKGNEDNV